MPPQDMRATPATATHRRTAADLMTAGPQTCSPFITVADAIVIIRDEDCGALPVVDGDRLVGVVTDRDVAQALTDNPGRADRPVSDIIRRGTVVVRPDDPLDLVKEKFGDRKVRCLLVIDSDDQLVGIIARADLVPHLPDEDVGEGSRGWSNGQPSLEGKRGG